MFDSIASMLGLEARDLVCQDCIYVIGLDLCVKTASMQRITRLEARDLVWQHALDVCGDELLCDTTTCMRDVMRQDMSCHEARQMSSCVTPLHACHHLVMSRDSTRSMRHVVWSRCMRDVHHVYHVRDVIRYHYIHVHM